MAAPARVHLAAVALAAATLGLVACGGSDDGEGGGAPAPPSEGTGSVDQRSGEAGASPGADSASPGADSAAPGGDAEGGDGVPGPDGERVGSGTAAEDGGEAGVGSGVYVGARRGVATDFLAFGVPRTEPKRLEVSGDAILVDLTWRGWGTARATATGTVRVNTCEPSCAEGEIERRPGAGAVVSGLETGECRADPGGSARFYTRVVIQFPPGLGLPGRQSVTLVARCVDGG